MAPVGMWAGINCRSISMKSLMTHFRTLKTHDYSANVSNLSLEDKEMSPCGFACL